MSKQLLEGYQLRPGADWERATLTKFLHRSYQELFPDQSDFSHLAETVRRYFSRETPVWWVELVDGAISQDSYPPQQNQPVACLWLGNAVDQVKGARHAHIFLLYVMPEHRRRGVGSALMRHAEDWARARGDHQIGLQVFQSNQPALSLYHQLGYQAQSLWMIKPIRPS